MTVIGGKTLIRMRYGAAVGFLSGALALCACATTHPPYPTPPPLRHAGAAVHVPDVDMLEVSPAMERFLDRYVMGYDNLQTRLYLLTLAINDPAILDFQYTLGRTLTAAEAFESRSGNCIAFANMFVALARRAGLDASYLEVSMQPEWSSHEDTLLVAKHINVVAGGPLKAFVIDISGRRVRLESRRRLMPDHEGKALYFSNLGAEALLRNDLPTAHAYLVKAIGTAPGMPDAWTNLGVVYKRNGQLDDAELAYRTAMANDSEENAAMANLYDLYVDRGNLEAAERLEAKVERYRRHNPYYLLLLGEQAIAEGRYGEAARLLRRAIGEKDGEHLFHFALARAQYLSGETGAAQESLDRARQLAPAEYLPHYEQPLQELVRAGAGAPLK